MSNQVQLDSGRPSDAESNPLAPYFGPLPPGMMKTQAADRYPHDTEAALLDSFADFDAKIRRLREAAPRQPLGTP